MPGVSSHLVWTESARRTGLRDRYSQRRSQNAGWGSGHPRLYKGGQGEEARRYFWIVGAYPLTHSWRNPMTVTWTIPQYQFYKTNQHIQRQGASQSMYTNTPLFWEGPATEKTAQNPRKCCLWRATNFTISMFCGWNQNHSSHSTWNHASHCFNSLNEFRAKYSEKRTYLLANLLVFVRVYQKSPSLSRWGLL